MKNEEERLRAAIATIHDHLHHNRINEAHKAAECAIEGKEVVPKNLFLSDAARLDLFMREFNALAQAHKMNACTVVLMESKTQLGAYSIQIGGQVMACEYVESQMTGRKSKYMGEH